RSQPGHVGLGHRGRSRSSRRLRLYPGLVADRAERAMGGVHRPALALLAAPAFQASHRQFVLAARTDGARAFDAVAGLRHLFNNHRRRRDVDRRKSRGLARPDRCRGHGYRLFRHGLDDQSAVASLDRAGLAARGSGAVRAAASDRGSAGVGGADAAAARRPRACAVAAGRAPPAMTDYDHAAIDELLHSRVRLAIVAFLAGAKTADFSAVRTAIKT